MKRVVLITGFPLSSFPDQKTVVVRFEKLSPEELRSEVGSANAVVSYIKHQTTASALKPVLGFEPPVTGMTYLYEPGDTVIAIILRKPGRKAFVTVDDLVFWKATVVASSPR